MRMPFSGRALGQTPEKGVQLSVIQQIFIELYAKPSFWLLELSNKLNKVLSLMKLIF